MKYPTILFRMVLVTGILMSLNNSAFSQEHHKNCDHSIKGMNIEEKGNDSVVIYLNKHDFSHFHMDGCPFGGKKGKFN